MPSMDLLRDRNWRLERKCSDRFREIFMQRSLSFLSQWLIELCIDRWGTSLNLNLMKLNLFYLYVLLYYYFEHVWNTCIWKLLQNVFLYFFFFLFVKQICYLFSLFHYNYSVKKQNEQRKLQRTCFDENRRLEKFFDIFREKILRLLFIVQIINHRDGTISRYLF